MNNILMRALVSFAGHEGRIRRGEEFRTSEMNARLYERGALAIRLSDQVERAPSTTEAHAPGAQTREAWPLRMPPDKYLERHPEGKHALLAQRILAGT